MGWLTAFINPNLSSWIAIVICIIVGVLCLGDIFINDFLPYWRKRHCRVHAEGKFDAGCTCIGGWYRRKRKIWYWRAKQFLDRFDTW